MGLLIINNELHGYDIGDNEAYDIGDNEAYDIGDNEADVVIPDGVESICSYAFSDEEIIKSVSIPASVHEIGGKAFANCISLENVIFSGDSTCVKIGYSAFEGCVSLKEIKLPESVEEIEHAAFKNCSELQEFILPPKAKMSLDRTFSGCTSLQTVILTQNISGWYRTTFTIGGPFADTFFGCTNLQTITGYEEADGEFVVKNGSIKNCHSLQYFIVPKNTTEIESQAFASVGKNISNAGDYFELILPERFKGVELKTVKNCYLHYYTDTPPKPGEFDVSEAKKVIEEKKAKNKIQRAQVKEKKAEEQNKKEQEADAVKKKLAAWIKKNKVDASPLAEILTDKASIKKWLEAQPVYQEDKYFYYNYSNTDFQKAYKRLFKTKTAPKLLLKNGNEAPFEALWYISRCYEINSDTSVKVTKDNYKTAIGTIKILNEVDQFASIFDQQSLCCYLAAMVFTEEYCFEKTYHLPTVIIDGKLVVKEDKNIYEDLTGYYDDYGIWYLEGSAFTEYAYPLCRYADERMIDNVCKWLNRYFRYDIYGKDGRNNMVYFRNALLLSDTERAFKYLETCGGKDVYLQMRGIKTTDSKAKTK